MRIRKFLETDREHCIAAFDSNVPDEYPTGARAEFAAYLDAAPAHFWVVEEQWRIIGCGGVHTEPDGETARLCWGLVASDHQHEGWGAFLLGALLAWARREPGLRRAVVKATGRNRGFFERFGFEAVAGGDSDEGDGFELTLDLSGPPGNPAL